MYVCIRYRDRKIGKQVSGEQVSLRKIQELFEYMNYNTCTNNIFLSQDFYLSVKIGIFERIFFNIFVYKINVFVLNT